MLTCQKPTPSKAPSPPTQAPLLDRLNGTDSNRFISAQKCLYVHENMALMPTMPIISVILHCDTYEVASRRQNEMLQ